MDREGEVNCEYLHTIMSMLIDNIKVQSVVGWLVDLIAEF